MNHKLNLLAIGMMCIMANRGFAQAPATAAPVPTLAAANVISLFSGAYTDLAATDWNPNWGQSTVVTDVQIAGNTTKLLSNLNYQGAQFATPVNVTNMTYLHIDVWTPTCTSFKVSLINIPPLTQTEQAFTITPTLSGWNSINIPLTAYNTINRAGIGQFKFEGLPVGCSVYLDNIYFHNTPVVVPVPVTAAPTPTALAANVISLFSGAYTDLAATDWNPNWGQSTVVTDVQIAGNLTKKLSNLNYQGAQFATPVNVTTMTHLHLDIWTPDCNTFKVFLVNIPPLTQTEQSFTVTPTLAGWNSIDIPLTAYNNINRAGIGQFKFEGTPGGSTVYLDNIYFFKPGTPLTAAPTPTALAANVMSLFSGAYTDIAGTDWNPNWGQSTVVTEIQIAGNATKKYANLNYQGVQLGAPINVTTMNFLHLDLWTPDCTSFKVSLISAGPVEQAVTLTPTLAGWNSFDIPLTSYTTPNKAAIIQLKFEGTTGSTVYLDNIYFFKTPAADPSQAVFTDDYAAGVTFVGFGGSTNAVTVDNTTAQSGTSSLKVVVPATGWTGGALAAATAQNLSTYNAVSFWVKASAAKTFNVTGLGNNGTPNGAVYQAEMLNIPVTTTWTKFIIPIPVPAKLNAETGLFHLAEGSEDGGYTVWFDNIQYEAISGGVIGTPTAAMATETINKAIGDAFSPNGLTSSFPINGVAKTVVPSKAYFTYASSTPAVATMSALGVGSALSAGTTNITAMLGAVAATGTLTVNVAAVAGPMVAAPTPTRPAASVMSLFSNAYTDIAGTDWTPNWGQTTVVTDIQIAGNATKKYSNLNYQGVQFAAPINVTAMNYFHLDLWTPNTTSFKVFLINIPPLTQTEQAVTLTPTLSGWNSFDIPLSSYNTINKTGIGQLKLEGTPSGTVVYLDNLFFFKTGVGTNDLKHSTDLFTVNPTLANDFVNINLNDNVKGSTQITFTTLTGQKVYEASLNADNLTKVKEISTQNLAAGMYIIGVRVGDSFQTQKIVVSH